MIQQFNTQYFEYYKINKDLSNPVLLDCVESGTISYNSLDSLKMCADLTVSKHYLEQLDIEAIRIYMVLNNEKSLLGTFLVSTPSSTFENISESLEVTCYSTLWLLKADKTDKRYYISKGTNAVNEVRRILNDRFSRYSNMLVDSDKTTSVDKEYEIGTPYIEIINDLLDCINYTSLYVDAEGTYIAKPYVLPKDREVEFTYNEDDVNNILETSCKSELDLFNVPNKFVRYISDAEVDLVATYTNEYGVTGTQATGIINVDAQEVKDVSDYDTLYNLCKKASAEATSIYHKVEFNTAINPNHLYMNCISLKYYRCNGKFIETSWDMQLETGGSMTHNVREVIDC